MRYIVQLVVKLPVIRVNKTVGMDRDVFSYIADLSEEVDTPFNDIMNELFHEAIEVRLHKEAGTGGEHGGE